MCRIVLLETPVANALDQDPVYFLAHTCGKQPGPLHLRPKSLRLPPLKGSDEVWMITEHTPGHHKSRIDPTLFPIDLAAPEPIHESGRSGYPTASQNNG